MRATRRIVGGVSAFAALAALLVGVPVALAIVVGWPLPHSWPTVTQVRTLLSTSGIPDVVLIDTLACICWLAWLDLAMATLVEIVATGRGRPAPRLLLVRPWQPFAARLVTAVVVAASAAGTRPQSTGPPHSVPLSDALAARHAPSSLVGDTRGSPQRAPATAGGARMAGSADPDGAEYVVRPGDTLWDISGRKLGSPWRWPEIWHRNRDRQEPGDRVFSNPNLILPGWELDIRGSRSQRTPPSTPAVEPPATAPNRALPTPSAAAPSPPAVTPLPVVGPGGNPPTPAPSVASCPPPTTVGPSAPGAGAPSGDQTSPGSSSSIRLPTGGFVGLSLAAAIGAALAAARLHERRRRWIGSCERSHIDDLVGPNVRRLRRALGAASGRRADGSTSSGAVDDHLKVLQACAAVPGRIPVGLRPDGLAEATVDIIDLSGMALVGPGAERALRALITAPIAAHATERAEVLLIGPAKRFLSGLEEVPGIEVIDDGPTAVARLNAQCIRRERVLADQGVDDYRTVAGSPDPLGALLAVVDDSMLGREHAAALTALVNRGRRLGISLVSAAEIAGFDCVQVADDGTVLGEPAKVANVVGRLFTLSETETRELLAVLSAGRGRVVKADESPQPDGHALEQHETELDVGAPDTSPADLRPVRVLVFGPPRVEVHSVEVATGLREKARELLCLLTVRRAGLRLDEGLAEMWPEDEDRHVDTFRVAVTGTRRRLREVTGVREGQFIVFAGERYRLDPTLVDADLWHFEAALLAASTAPDEAARRESLERAAQAIGGEPFAGAAFEWVESVRENLRRRAVDALAELAGLRAASGDETGALAALEQARSVDPYCEDVYRRLMRQLADAGRDGVALRVYRELERQLGELGTEPDEETEALMVEVRAREWRLRYPSPGHQSPAGPRFADDEHDAAAGVVTTLAARRAVLGGPVALRRPQDSRGPTSPTDQPDLPILDEDGDSST